MFPRGRLSSLRSNDHAPGPAPLRCWVETSRGALLHNVAALRAHTAGAGIIAVVKANAYGHGAAGVVETLAGHVQMLGVANLTEALDVATYAQGTPILILGTALAEERAAIIAGGFIPVVSSAAEAAAFAVHGPVKAHLAVDSGMGRMGILEDDALAELRAALAIPGVEITGLCSHLPVADEDDDFTHAQLQRFRALVEKARTLAGRALLAHVENSAGAIAFPAFAPDLFRAGLAIYGIAPRAEFQPRLLPALTWKSRVILVRDLGPGRGVSYGRTFITERPMQIATVAAGYADGYPRQISGHGAEVLIRGQRRPVLGRVTMDQIMVDVTGSGVTVGDEVVLLGKQGDAEIPATEVAARAGTIAWDILAGIGARVARQFVG